MAELDDLRSRIDQLDGALIAIIAERLAVCRPAVYAMSW